jgi:hypothetical protein
MDVLMGVRMADSSVEKKVAWMAVEKGVKSVVQMVVHLAHLSAGKTAGVLADQSASTKAGHLAEK